MAPTLRRTQRSKRRPFMQLHKRIALAAIALAALVTVPETGLAQRVVPVSASRASAPPSAAARGPRAARAVSRSRVGRGLLSLGRAPSRLARGPLASRTTGLA